MENGSIPNGDGGTAPKSPFKRFEGYNFPDVIQYLQKEFRRFESERELWELDRAEMQIKVASLESMRRSQEKIQYDLLRRIKMLEFALRSERFRYKQTVEQLRTSGGLTEEVLESLENVMNLPSVQTGEDIRFELSEIEKELSQSTPASVAKLLAGQQPPSNELLKQYLEDINCSDAQPFLSRTADTTSFVTSSPNPYSPASNSLASLGSFDSPSNTLDKPVAPSPMAIIREDTLKPDLISVPEKQELKPAEPAPITQAPESATPVPAPNPAPQSSVQSQPQPQPQPEPIEQEKQPEPKAAEQQVEPEATTTSQQQYQYNPTPRPSTPGEDESSIYSKFNTSMKKKVSFTGAKEQISEKKTRSLNILEPKKKTSKKKEPESPKEPAESKHTRMESAPSAMMSSSFKSFVPKSYLYNHLDAVRSIAFHPTSPILITGSEDWTVKFWNITEASSKSVISQPGHTFRGHTGPVYTVKCSEKYCFSAGEDGDVRVWELPSIDHNPYTNYGIASPLLKTVLKGHSNVIWSLALHKTDPFILSASSDGCVKLWNYSTDTLINTYSVSEESTQFTPTSVSYLANDQSKLLISCTNSVMSLLDIETGKSIWKSKTVKEADVKSESLDHTIYQLVSHPTFSIAIAGYEDKHIRFIDTNSGQCTYEMVGHRDAVSCLSIDPSGLYLMSGGHDSTLRVWDIQTKQCVQDLLSHRKKYDESVHSIDQHPTKNYLASSGADATVRIFCQSL